MAVKVVMPKLGLTMTQGQLVSWLVADGTPVRKGQPIFTIETDKATIESEAPADGILVTSVAAGTMVPVNGLVGYVLAPGEVAPDAPTESLAPAVPVPAPADAEKPASPAAKRRARELGIDLGQVTGSGEAGRITLEDVEAYAAAAASTQQPAAEAGALRASPMARRLAREAGIDLNRVQGSGEGGRITREDVERAAAQRPAVSPPGAQAPEVPAAPTAEAGQLIPISGVRAVVASRMHASQQQTAAVTITTEVDASALVELRTQLNERLAEQLGFRIGYNDILIYITARALREFPYMNARQEGEAIRLLPEVHLGLAVDTERGLLVPVVRDADRKSIVRISRELREKIERALAGRSLPDELSGSTFTLTNLGMYGIDVFTPIINPPELAILGVGRIEQKPAAYQGQLALRHRMALSLTFDHRLVDGAPAARFLQRIASWIEQPFLMLAQLG